MKPIWEKPKKPKKPKKSKKKKRKSPTRTIKRKCDKEFSLRIRERDGYKCRACGESYTHSYMHCAHIVSRGDNATRYDPENAVCLCRNCHMYYSYRPSEWILWVNANLGDGHYEKMLIKSKEKVKIDYPELLKTLKSIKY